MFLKVVIVFCCRLIGSAQGSADFATRQYPQLRSFYEGVNGSIAQLLFHIFWKGPKLWHTCRGQETVAKRPFSPPAPGP